ncbi:monovalent cation:proton antiporter-2 (CPA2) family protein [Haliangium sp. UPWRP_2]|uniref:monovalent cation:proton antiporter-2 (CPA2) family protein n=1 Tax=Haliangium sp. UPWRP_2 TaxID=1931276 RepID=UPI000B54269B|nr:monovalent cation:proton antiporter-2 (CPA2) family protein [Haliangium sp. UPWRP_2]PSM32337.1 glutathione-regulated potassium-efflux system protein KefB [Haliangium sp. UPWRP_2]
MSLLHQSLILLVAAVLAVPLFRKLKLGAVLGYLAAGVAVGPFALRLITDVQSILHFSEFGVVLMLFLIGLELNPSRLWVLRRDVFGLGGAQVLAVTGVFAASGVALGVHALPALIAGFGMALSSTAFVLPVLAERGQLQSPQGNATFAILLFQDLAVIPLLDILPLLAGGAAAGHGPAAAPTSGFMLAAKIIVALVGLVLAGRYLLRPAFRAIAASGNQEIMTAMALLVVVATSALMEKVGLSASLGAFLSGVLLAESEYRHELHADIEPFKGLLLGLFFMAVGMSANLGIVRERPLALLGFVVGFMALKALVVYFVARRFGQDRASATGIAGALSQGGEFAFVLFGIATAAHVMSQRDADFLIVAVTMSMALTPLALMLGDRFIARLSKQVESREFDTVAEKDHENPVVIAGFGRVGQIVGRMLSLHRIGFTALDAASTHVDFVRKFGNKIYYGDATRLDLLRSAHAERAKVFVVAIDDMVTSLKVVELVQHHFPHLTIVARARNRPHAYQLLAMGVSLVIRETFEGSLTMAQHTLVALGMTEDKAQAATRKFADYDEARVRAMYMFRNDQQKLIDSVKQYASELEGLFATDEQSSDAPAPAPSRESPTRASESAPRP